MFADFFSSLHLLLCLGLLLLLQERRRQADRPRVGSALLPRAGPRGRGLLLVVLQIRGAEVEADQGAGLGLRFGQGDARTAMMMIGA